MSGRRYSIFSSSRLKRSRSGLVPSEAVLEASQDFLGGRGVLSASFHPGAWLHEAKRRLHGRDAAAINHFDERGPCANARDADMFAQPFITGGVKGLQHATW